MSGSCLTCRFWLPTPLGAQPYPETDGICRRNAPRGPTVKNTADGWQIFPPMNSNQWCGEHAKIRIGAVAKRVSHIEAARTPKGAVA